MVQVVRIAGPQGQRVLYLREGCLASLRRATGEVECVVRRLPDFDGRVLVAVDGREVHVPVGELHEL